VREVIDTGPPGNGKPGVAGKQTPGQTSKNLPQVFHSGGFSNYQFKAVVIGHADRSVLSFPAFRAPFFGQSHGSASLPFRSRGIHRISTLGQPEGPVSSVGSNPKSRQQAYSIEEEKMSAEPNTLEGAQNTPEGRGGVIICFTEAQNSPSRVAWKPVATSWSNSDGQFTQIWRSGDVAIFEQHRNGLLIAYEVIIVKKVPGRKAFGKFYEAHEAYPSFGKVWTNDGWTFGRQYRERAFELAKGLVRNLGLPKKQRLSSVELLTAVKEAGAVKSGACQEPEVAP
jgi:hypothetical protein